MPSHRKRIGFLPSKEVHDLIESISKDNNFSQSRVTGLLVEEALRSRGLLNNLLEENDVITDHKYEDIEINKENVFETVINFINNLKGRDTDLNQKKFLNSIKSTNFSNLRNKEINEGFDEKVSSKKTGKIINFFNLGFNNRWQKLLPSDIKEKLNKKFEKELRELNYFL